VLLIVGGGEVYVCAQTHMRAHTHIYTHTHTPTPLGFSHLDKVQKKSTYTQRFHTLCDHTAQ